MQHASFVQKDSGLYQHAEMVIQHLYHKRKFRQIRLDCSFNIWFTDFKSDKVEINDYFHFFLELLL